MDSTATPSTPRARALAARLGVVVAAVVLGLILHEALSGRLAEIAARAEQDIDAARRELAFLMRAMLLPVLGLTTAVGVVIARSARRSLREERFPPTDSRLWGRRSGILTGAPARRRASFALGLGLALVLCSLSAAGLVWWITRVLLLCRA